MKDFWNRNKTFRNVKVAVVFGLDNHVLFILHILTYYDFLRILLILEVWIVIKEVDVGNILFISIYIFSLLPLCESWHH